jgi:hypothetical protein
VYKPEERAKERVCVKVGMRGNVNAVGPYFMCGVSRIYKYAMSRDRPYNEQGLIVTRWISHLDKVWVDTVVKNDGCHVGCTHALVKPKAAVSCEIYVKAQAKLRSNHWQASCRWTMRALRIILAAEHGTNHNRLWLSLLPQM